MLYKTTEEEEQRISGWLAALHITHKAKFETAEKGPFKNCFTNYGAIGGGLTYSFTPNNLGVVFKVTEALTGKELDLTDYDSW